MTEKLTSNELTNDRKNLNDVAFNAYDSEITITQSEDLRSPSNDFPSMFTSPLTSLRSLTRKSFSRSVSGNDDLPYQPAYSIF